MALAKGLEVFLYASSLLFVLGLVSSNLIWLEWGFAVLISAPIFRVFFMVYLGVSKKDKKMLVLSSLLLLVLAVCVINGL